MCEHEAYENQLSFEKFGRAFLERAKQDVASRCGVSPVFPRSNLILSLFLPSCEQWETRRPRPVVARFAVLYSTGELNSSKLYRFQSFGRSRADSAANEKTETR